MAKQKAGYLLVHTQAPSTEGDLSAATYLGEFTAGTTLPVPETQVEEFATGAGGIEASGTHTARLIGQESVVAPLQTAADTLAKQVFFIVSRDLKSYTQVRNASVIAAYVAGHTEAPNLKAIVVRYASKNGAVQDFYTRHQPATMTFPAGSPITPAE